MMKKVFYLLMVALLVIGCGGGGGTTTSSSSGDTGGGGGISGPVGTIKVVFTGSGPAPSAPVLRSDNVTLESGFTLGSLSPESGFRVSVSKYVTETNLIGYTKVLDEGEIPTPIYQTVTLRTYFNFVDNTAPGEITLKVPVDNGYLIEVISYDKDPKLDTTSPRQMRRYGYVDNITINEGPNTIPLAPSPTSNGRPFAPITENTILFSRSQQITGGNLYTMNVTYNSRVPLRDSFNFADNTSNSFVFNDTNIDNTLYKIGVSFTRMAPVGLQDDNIYFQGQFYINDSMLSNAEQQAKGWKKFRLNAPATYNNEIYQQLYLPGDVFITI